MADECSSARCVLFLVSGSLVFGYSWIRTLAIIRPGAILSHYCWVAYCSATGLVGGISFQVSAQGGAEDILRGIRNKRQEERLNDVRLEPLGRVTCVTVCQGHRERETVFDGCGFVDFWALGVIDDEGTLRSTCLEAVIANGFEWPTGL
ncbi:hypothetical protein QBC37DRAFT_404664 [Rhypophila decipiens]|uniref:Uncharacterized protein n=1 Tax=Rhypophila decipiens TaxID=261697 RepID=A0AAN7B5P8_9PEZI|nr:hypothetical protein QBC37DRAFT_404664 [Rhypophila decipiens]